MAFSGEKINGFRDPDEYHTSSLTVAMLNFGLFAVLVGVFFPDLFPSFLATIPYSTVESINFLIENQTQIIELLVFSVALIAVHELAHVAAHKLNGFNYAYGVKWVWTWKIPNPVHYVVVLDDPLTRSENIAGLLAPLVVLNMVGVVGLLPVFPAAVSYYAKVLLVVNTAGSCSDIYHSIKVARHQPGTLFQNIMSNGEIQTFTYEPTDDAAGPGADNVS